MTPTKTPGLPRAAKRAASTEQKYPSISRQERDGFNRVRGGVSEHANREVLGSAGEMAGAGRAVLKVQEILVVKEKLTTEVRTSKNSLEVGVYCFRHGKFDGKICKQCRVKEKTFEQKAHAHAMEVYRDCMEIIERQRERKLG